MPPSTRFNVSALVRPNILALTPYRCARDDYSKGLLLDANENALGPALPDHSDLNLSLLSLHRYPDPRQRSVRQVFAKFRDISSVNIFCGVGSDEAIDILIRVFCRPTKDKILICPPTYGMYAVSAHINDVPVVRVPLHLPTDGGVSLEQVFQLDMDALKAKLSTDPDIKLVFLCSPGNPTGLALRKLDIRELLEMKDWHGLVIVDEAYIDFTIESTEDGGRGSVVSWISEFPNLVILQTLSKSFGLAGLRMGIAMASPEIIHYMDNTKAPYNCSALTQDVAKMALTPENIQIMRSHAQTLIERRDSSMRAILAIPGVEPVIPVPVATPINPTPMRSGDANFFLVRIMDRDGVQGNNGRATMVYRWLAEQAQVVVRFRGNEPGMEGALRISSPGTRDEEEKLVRDFREAMEVTTDIWDTADS